MSTMGIDGDLREGNILRVGRLALVFQTADEQQSRVEEVTLFLAFF